MRKNESNQIVHAQLNKRSDGTPYTGLGVSVDYIGDAGGIVAGGGTLTHLDNGLWEYLPTQAETNFQHVTFRFTHADIVAVIVQYYPIGFLNSEPQVATTQIATGNATIGGNLNVTGSFAITNDLTIGDDFLITGDVVWNGFYQVDKGVLFQNSNAGGIGFHVRGPADGSGNGMVTQADRTLIASGFAASPITGTGFLATARIHSLGNGSAIWGYCESSDGSGMMLCGRRKSNTGLHIDGGPETPAARIWGGDFHWTSSTGSSIEIRSGSLGGTGIDAQGVGASAVFANQTLTTTQTVLGSTLGMSVSTATAGQPAIRLGAVGEGMIQGILKGYMILDRLTATAVGVDTIQFSDSPGIGDSTFDNQIKGLYIMPRKNSNIVGTIQTPYLITAYDALNGIATVYPPFRTNDAPQTGTERVDLAVFGSWPLDAPYATSMVENDGSKVRFTANALELAPTGGGGGTGTGARTVTIIVNNGSTPLEGAYVRMTKGAETYVSTTDVDGEIIFSLDDGTWGVAITLPGHIFTPTTLAISSDKVQTYSMTPLTFSPSNPGQVTAFSVVYNANGTVNTTGVVVTATVIAFDEDLSGVILSGNSYSATSNGSGLVQFPNLFKGVTYRFKAGTGKIVSDYHIPDDAISPYELPYLRANPT